MGERTQQNRLGAVVGATVRTGRTIGRGHRRRHHNYTITQQQQQQQ